MNLLKGKPFIVADVGSTWKRAASQSENKVLTLKAIESAAKCGVDAVKFQMYKTSELYGFSRETEYELPSTWLEELKIGCDKVNVEFMCTAFSPAGVQVVDDFVKVHKIASCEMKDLEILTQVINCQKPFLISTGCAHWSEILFVEQFIKDCPHPDFAFLECVASYPAEVSDYNIGWCQGISDHTLDNTAALVALGTGCFIFEKHFDAFKDFGFGLCPDSVVSIGPNELKNYVNSIRSGSIALTNGDKRPRKSEDSILKQHRRRVMAIKDIKRGEKLIKNENFGSFRAIKEELRAAAPEKVDLFDGKITKVDIPAGNGIWFDDILI